MALASISLSPGSAQAACAPGTPSGTCRVTVGGLQYDVTTFIGSYNDTTNKFATPPAPGVMPWWGDSSTAAQFAAAVGNGLGNPNFGNYCPAFAYNISGVVNLRIINLINSSVIDGVFPSDTPTTWAQVQVAPVPAPLPIFGAGAAFGFSRQMRKRIQGSRLPAGSGEPLA